MRKYTHDARELLSTSELYEVKGGDGIKKTDDPKPECSICSQCVACSSTCLACSSTMADVLAVE